MICSGDYQFLFVLTYCFHPRLCQNTNVKSGPGFGGQVNLAGKYLVSLLILFPSSHPENSGESDSDCNSKIASQKYNYVGIIEYYHIILAITETD